MSQIFSTLKKQLSDELEQLTLENANKQKQKIDALWQSINHYLTYLSLAKPKTNTLSNKEANIHLETEKTIQNQIPENVERLTRLIRNGRLEKLNCMIAESIIRENNWENGDWIEVVEKNGNRFFQLYKKDPIATQRKECKMLLVEKANIGNLAVSVKDHNLDAMFEVPISKEDIEKYKLEEGDIVDFAYTNEMLKGKITWKYPIEQKIETPSPTVEKKESKIANNHEEKEIIESDLQEESKKEGIFKDLTILMVGSPNNKIKINNQQAIEKRDGTFIYLHGSESKKKIQTEVNKADVIIVYTQAISHHAMWGVKEQTKLINKDKATSYTKTLGSEMFVQRVSSVLKKVKEQLPETTRQ